MTYDEIRKQRCEWCANGIPIDRARYRRNEDGMDEQTRKYRTGVPLEPLQHVIGYTDFTAFNVPNKWKPCTAPSPEALITEQADQIRRLREALNEALDQYDGVEDMIPEMAVSLERWNAALSSTASLDGDVRK